MIYEYRCTHCGSDFELEQSIKDKPIKDCTYCNSVDTVVRLVTGGQGFVLKGSGWAKDLYSKQSSK